MNRAKREVVEEIQRTAARLLATNPAGHGLFLIGGFRLRYLDGSSRMSNDIDYHWDGNLDTKQKKIISLFRRKLLPEVKLRLKYDGTVSPATGPDADTASVRTVLLAFYQEGVPYSRIEIPVDITRIVCLDAPVVRTMDGVVFVTASDADIVESKLISVLERIVIAGRDLVDLFLFQNRFTPDSRGRLHRKFLQLSLDEQTIAQRLRDMQKNREHHIRSIDEVIAGQLDPEVASSIKQAGGAATVFDSVMNILQDQLRLMH